ncbi:MFS transporter [Lysobacter korlensis]|uniref:MFS transporter n=1 Tax=Lysobacter korlensis TaxID=553636 RepID=A0ABV6S1B8_9GAMM
MGSRYTPARTRLVLAVLFTGAFTMGCAEMLVVGLLDRIAADLEVPVPAAGALVTANALGIAIGGPLLTFATTRLDRRTVLLGATIAFVSANLLPAFGADYALFLAARVGIGAVQGLFIAAAMVTATAIVPPERTGRAMALVISGFATASAFGLPVGTLLGQAVGWRGSFVAVVGVGTVLLVVAIVVLPSVPASAGSRAIGQARHAFAPRVLAMLVLSCLIFVAIQSALTYVVPFLNDATGVSGPALSVFLLAYGLATTIGSIGGGRFADSGAARSLLLGTIGLTGSLAALFLFGGHPLVAGLAIVGIGLFGMGMAPSMQHRVVALSGPGAPLASSLPASAVNAGIAFGSFAGGAAIGAAGVPAAVLTGAGVAVIAVAVAWATRLLRPVAITAGSSGVAEPTPAS